VSVLLIRDRKGLLFHYARQNAWVYVVTFITVIATVTLAFINPQITGQTIDAVLGDQPLKAPAWMLQALDQLGGIEFLRSNIWICAVGMVLVAGLNLLTTFLRSRWVAIASENISRNMRDDLYDHLQRLPYDYHVKAETGDLIQRCTTDVETIRRFLAGQVVELTRIILMVVVSAVILFGMHVKLTLAAMSLMPLLVISSFLYLRRIQSKFTYVEEADGHLSTVMQENLTGVRVVRAFGREAFEREKFSEANRNMRDRAFRLNCDFAGFWSLTDFVAALPVMIVLVYGVFLAARREITVGNFIVFNTYVGMMMWPLRSLGRILSDMSKTLIAAGRLTEILNQPLETSGDHPVKPNLKGDIVFDHVTFGYNRSKPILKDLSMTIPAGKTVAILGATGSGKSSLVMLLQRLYDYQGGSIKLNGTELKRIEKEYLRQRVSIVLQEPFLYSKTIRDNVAVTMPDVEDELIYEATRVAAVHDVIQEFEGGYDTIVGERGVTLSGGQKQRVAIARTLMRDSDVLIFDDSLSAVDTETDAQIRAALNERRQGVTTIIISHRISTLMEADRIFVLEDGTITAQGTHEELMQQPGLYRRVYDIQNAVEAQEKGVEA
jgi:ATP-binding cassette subfamily B protein